MFKIYLPLAILFQNVFYYSRWTTHQHTLNLEADRISPLVFQTGRQDFRTIFDSSRIGPRGETSVVQDPLDGRLSIFRAFQVLKKNNNKTISFLIFFSSIIIARIASLLFFFFAQRDFFLFFTFESRGRKKKNLAYYHVC